MGLGLQHALFYIKYAAFYAIVVIHAKSRFYIWKEAILIYLWSNSFWAYNLYRFLLLAIMNCLYKFEVQNLNYDFKKAYSRDIKCQVFHFLEKLENQGILSRKKLFKSFKKKEHTELTCNESLPYSFWIRQYPYNSLIFRVMIYTSC